MKQIEILSNGGHEKIKEGMMKTIDIVRELGLSKHEALTMIKALEESFWKSITPPKEQTND